MKYRSLLLLAVIWFALASAKDENNDNNKSLPIADESDAKQTADMVNSACNKVRDDLLGINYKKSFNNKYTSQKIENSRGGYCIVSGTYDRSYSSANSDVLDDQLLSITVTFYNYTVYTDGSGKIDGGPVYFYSNSSSSTGGYISSYSSVVDYRSITGSNIHVSTDGMDEVISLEVTNAGGSSTSMTGTLTCKNGTFSF